MTPATLIVLACAFDDTKGQWTRDCVAWTEHVANISECRDRYSEIKASLPAGIRLGWPECVAQRAKR